MIDLPTGPSNRSALLTRDALTRWESRHGHVPHGSFVLLRTGWAEFYDQPDKFIGNFMGESKQVYPGMGKILFQVKVKFETFYETSVRIR